MNATLVQVVKCLLSRSINRTSRIRQSTSWPECPPCRQVPTCQPSWPHHWHRQSNASWSTPPCTTCSCGACDDDACFQRPCQRYVTRLCPSGPCTTCSCDDDGDDACFQPPCQRYATLSVAPWARPCPSKPCTTYCVGGDDDACHATQSSARPFGPS